MCMCVCVNSSSEMTSTDNFFDQGRYKYKYEYSTRVTCIWGPWAILYLQLHAHCLLWPLAIGHAFVQRAHVSLFYNSLFIHKVNYCMANMSSRKWLLDKKVDHRSGVKTEYMVRRYEVTASQVYMEPTGPWEQKNKTKQSWGKKHL